MPVFQRDPHEADYWGYMPLNFFAPHAHYASSRDKDGQNLEFRNMVKALHRAGIAVVLDVVYNHTCEGDHTGTDLQLQRLRWSELLHAILGTRQSLRELLRHRQHSELRSSTYERW